MAGPTRSTSSWLARIRDRDHTTSAVLPSLMALSIPSIVTSVGAFGLFQLVDLAFLGRLGPDALAAAGATNQTLRQVIFLLVLGVTTATQMLVARSIGAGHPEEAEHVAGQSILVGGVLWVSASAAGLFFAEPLVALVVRDPDAIAMGASYVRVAFPFLVTAIFTQLATAILSGAGDTTTPMLASFLVTPAALLGEWALGFGKLGMPALGIEGIAWGAGLGGLVGTGVLLAALFRGGARVHLRARHLRPDPKTLVPLLRFSWQPALHMLARTTIVFFFMTLAGRLGADVQAAYTIGLRLEMIPIMVAFPIANACATLVGQNLGAGSLPRAWQAIRVTFVVELAALWPVALVLFFFRHGIVGLFTEDPAVASLAAEYLGYSSVILGFYGLYFASFRSLQAAGDMRSPMIISICVALFLGVPLALVLTRTDLGATGMWIANLTYALVNALLMIGWLLRGRWADPHRTPGAPPSPTGGTT
jgi:putative MATE family efflux protein